MKTRFWQWLFAATLIPFSFALRAADAEEQKPAEAPVEDAAAAKAAPATNTSVAIVQAPTNVAVAAAPLIPQQLSLPPLLDQVVKLGKSGTDESVVRAYVEKAAPPYQITGNEIIQLQDLGVPKSVILALIEHSKTATPNTAEAPAPVPTQTAAVTPAATTNAPVPPPTDAASDYYESLAPYGRWTDVPGYGWCWQPTVVVVNPGWRPYWDNGYWDWSDSGWYWNSYYSWGWAPFHYGRWFCHGGGWYWYPDRVWGPSWVCWRNTPTHCGWAPLPPGACFTAGIGWTHHGLSVGVGFGFGIASAHFNFVSHGHFTDHRVSRHGLHGHDANTAYAHSRVVNNYSVGANGRMVNHGIGREQVAAARGAPIQTASTSELTRRGHDLSTRTVTTAQGGRGAMNNVNGSQLSRNTVASVAPRSTWQGSAANAVQRNTVQRNATATASRPVGQLQQAVPNVQRQPAFRNNYAAATARGSTMPRVNNAPRINTTPQFQQRYAGAGVGRANVAPRSFTPRAAAPRQFSPQSFGSRPSFQSRGSGFAGNVSRGGSISVGRSFAARR